MKGSIDDARGQVLERFRSYLLLLAEAIIGQPNRVKLEASDVVQQTLLEAHRQWDQFRGQSDAERAGWLRQILQNNMKDAARALGRGKRDVARERSLEAAVEESSARLNAWLAAEQTSPSQAAIKAEDLLRMTEALSRLPEDQRKAVVLRHLGGLSLVELAGRLGRSESAVAGLIHRGLKELREVLGAEG
jgi:RNA polymerase sigma-70 factor (ECF subfamily)